MFLHLSVIVLIGGWSSVSGSGGGCLPLDPGGSTSGSGGRGISVSGSREGVSFWDQGDVPLGRHPSPLEMTIEAGSMHPTGMHSYI